MPIGELFDDLWSNDAYDLAVYDEFVAKRVRPQSTLNQFADGQKHSMRIKCGQVLKTHNIPFIILSNFPPEATIAADQLPMFNVRFDVVHVEEPIQVDSIAISEVQSSDISSQADSSSE